MQKIYNYVIKRYRRPHLFKEDLFEIENVLKELKSSKYTVSADGYGYKDIAEAIQDKKILKSLRYQSYSPLASINFDEKSASAYIGEDNNELLGTLVKISEIIKKRERKFTYYLRDSLAANIITGMLPFPSLLLISISISQKVGNIYSLMTNITSITMLLYLAFVFFSRNKYSLIENRRKNDAQSFLERNRDLLIIGTITTIVGTLIGFYLAKILKLQ